MQPSDLPPYSPSEISFLDAGPEYPPPQMESRTIHVDGDVYAQTEAIARGQGMNVHEYVNDLLSRLAAGQRDARSRG